MLIPVSEVPLIKNLIIADDDRDDQVLLKEIIDEHPYAPLVTTVMDGSQLMQIIAGGLIPDLILLDLNMPNKNGIECLYEIRTELGMNEIPIVMLSTSKEQRDIEACYTNGAHLFFSKPYTFDSLRTLVNSILSINWKEFNTKLNKEDFIRIAAEGIHCNLLPIANR